MLLEAHQIEAWAVLGYPTWAAYVRAEFDMSRGNANRLVAQGEIIAAIEAAIPETDEVARARATPTVVSARQATIIQKNPKALSAVKKAIKKGIEPTRAVRDVVSRQAPTNAHGRKDQTVAEVTRALAVVASAEISVLAAAGKPHLHAVQRKINNTLVAIRNTR